jgi:ketosteroid isomerase-like protein
MSRHDMQAALVDRFNHSWQREDLDGVLACITEDFEFDWSDSRSPFQGVYRGHEGLMQYWAEQVDAWEEFTIDVVENIWIDAERVLSVNTVRGRGSSSGNIIDSTGVMLWTFRGAKLASGKLCQTKEEAFAAAGVTGPAPGPPTPGP